MFFSLCCKGEELLVPVPLWIQVSDLTFPLLIPIGPLVLPLTPSPSSQPLATWPAPGALWLGKPPPDPRLAWAQRETALPGQSLGQPEQLVWDAPALPQPSTSFLFLCCPCLLYQGNEVTTRGSDTTGQRLESEKRRVGQAPD